MAVYAFLESNTIDFTVKIPITESSEPFLGSKYTTYLHIAAAHMPEIFQLFIEGNFMDINVTNDLGETPFMVACRYGILNNINIMVYIDVDYLHRNNEGKDVLDILGFESASDVSKVAKEDYFGLLNNVIQNIARIQR